MQPAALTPVAEVSARGGWRWGLALILAIFAWLACTKFFWVGYAGTDDLFYARYAFLFNRKPINWWECRLPAILAIRAAFLWLGVSEFAAALPTLIAALAATAAIAWYVRWPQYLNWRTNSTVLLAITLPLDVTFRTVPGASYMAASLLVVGSVCVLKGRGFLRWAGCGCFAAAISTHELSLYYTGIFWLTSLVFDRRRFLRPLVVSIVLSLAAVGAQCVYYAVRFGDPLLRFHLAESTLHYGLFDPDTQLAGLRFLLWPIQIMVFSKTFSCDLLILFFLGAAAWKKLLTDQRILLVSGFVTWLYLGFGSKVPWAYQPLARQFHFYGPLTLSLAVLLPVSIGHWFRNSGKPRRWSVAAVAGIVVLHLACLAGGGKWGQAVKVSRLLLDYASSHPSSTFLTDVGTMNHMYVQSGFRLPPNVICRNGPTVEQSLLVNKEPPNRELPHGVTFPDLAVDGILLNLEQMDSSPGGDPDFSRFLADSQGPHQRIVPIRYKPLFAPAQSLLRGRTFAIASQGAELIRLH